MEKALVLISCAESGETCILYLCALCVHMGCAMCIVVLRLLLGMGSCEIYCLVGRDFGDWPGRSGERRGL
jgi:hypothetical protein